MAGGILVIPARRTQLSLPFPTRIGGDVLSIPVNSNLPSLVSRITPRNLFATAAGVLGGVLIGVLAAGGTYALWNGQVTIDAPAITTGTTGLTIEDETDHWIPGLDLTLLVPGSAIATALDVANIGNVDLSVAVSSVDVTGDLAEGLDAILVPVVDESACTTDVDGQARDLIGFDSSDSPVAIGAGEVEVYCLVMALEEGASPELNGTTAGFTLVFDGTQVAP